MSPRTIIATWPGRIVVLILVAAVGGGAFAASRSKAPADTPTLRTATVARGSITQAVSVSGTVNASSQARLAFNTAGKLAEVYVTVGQGVDAGMPLAKLDTTDLETAMSTAQQNLDNAQASYQKAQLAAADTQRSLADTQTSTAADVASAEQSLAKLRTSYASAKTNFTSLTNSSRSEAIALQTAVDDFDGVFSALLGDLSIPTQTGDVRSATSSINTGLNALDIAKSYSTGLLQTALNQFQNAQYTMLQIAAAYDAALDAGGDTSAVLLQWQTQQIAYSDAVSRLTSAIDAVTAQMSTAQSSAASALASVSTTNSLQDPNLDPIRETLRGLPVRFTTQLQYGSSAKSHLTSASTFVSTIDSVIGGSIASAVQAVTSAKERAATSVRNAQSAVANIPYNLQSAQVSVQNAQNAVDTATKNLAAAVLKAPTAGTVASIANQVGEFVSGGSTNNAFIVLTNTKALSLRATVGEANVSTLKLGLVANVTVDALQGARMTGKVISLDPVATISQGVPVYGVDIAIDVPAEGVRAGMSGTANVILASKQNVLVVPNAAIRTLNGRRGVQVLKDGETVDTQVTLGLSNDTVTEVVSGLAEGDVVVLPQLRATGTANPQQRPGQGGFQAPAVPGEVGGAHP